MHNRNRGDNDIWWGLGNGQPSEKLDGFWHAAHLADSEEAFHRTVANQGVFIPSNNEGDAEPSTQYFNSYGSAYSQL